MSKLCPLRFVLEEAAAIEEAVVDVVRKERTSKRDRQRARAVGLVAESAREAQLGSVAESKTEVDQGIALDRCSSALAESESLNRSLRHGCADHRGAGVHEITAIIDASADVNAANSNGKTPLMFASQLRSDPDVAALLLQRDADVNATTHRGHTALLYACGRGHETIVTLLLSSGADVATRTVGGDTPATMAASRTGGSRMTADMLHRLAALEAGAGPVRDFGRDPRALHAQAEHVRTCRCCQLKLREAGVAPPAETAAAELAASLGAAAEEGDAELSRALLRAATTEGAKGLRQALIFSLSGRGEEEGAEGGSEGGNEGENEGGGWVVEETVGQVVGVRQLLRAARDESLGRTLGKGVRGKDRRPVRVVGGAVYAALCEPLVVDALVCRGVHLAEICSEADAHLAAEIVARWPVDGRGSPGAFAETCAAVLAQLSGRGGWAPAGIGGLARRAGGPRVAAWCRAIRWAAELGYDGWDRAALELVETARCASALKLLLASLAAHVLPPDLQLLLEREGLSAQELAPGAGAPRVEGVACEGFEAGAGQSSAVASGGGKGGGADDGAGELNDVPLSSLPLAQLEVVPTWVPSEANEIGRLHSQLRAEAKGCAGTLRVGVDTEWGDGSGAADGKGAPTAPCVATVQIATEHAAWIVDAMGGNDAALTLSALMRWLLTDRSVTLLGFAFDGDLVALSSLDGPDAPPMPRDNLLDLQRAVRRRGEDTPSLQRVCARLLGARLDKTEQCSDWSARPLRREQFLYAALDARILIDVHEAFLSAERERGGAVR